MKRLVALAVWSGVVFSLGASVDAAESKGAQKPKPKRGLELVKKGMKAQREREQMIERKKETRRKLAENGNKNAVAPPGSAQK